MRDADHRRLRLAHARARMAGQAFVAADADLVAFGRMRDERGLLRVVPRFAIRRVLLRRHDRRLALLVERRRPAQRREGLRRRKRRGGEQRERGEQGGAAMAAMAVHGRPPQARAMRTAHFLKSVCSEIGSVASSVTLLMSWLSSNHGTNTTPRGMRL